MLKGLQLILVEEHPIRLLWLVQWKFLQLSEQRRRQKIFKMVILVIVDGLNGEVHINPTPEVIEQYEEEQQEYEKQKAEWAKLVNEKTVTADGHHVELAANIGTPEDLEGLLKMVVKE